MANYDAGHYFLTMMAPVDRNQTVKVDGVRRSTIDHVRRLLSTLPTAQQDIFSSESDLQSPFAAVPGTHFAHWFVIDDLRYNGRRPSNAILDLIFNVQMTEAENVDTLPTAYVVLALDFDAVDGSAAALRSYTDTLWRGMSQTLKMVFGNCIDFDKVKDETSFFEYVQKTQITTSLPFNDYWTQEPPNRSPVPWMAFATAAILLAAIAAFATGIWPWSGWTLIAATFVSILLTVVAIVVRFGTTPFDPAPDSDLKSVLKGLYIQQMLTGFAIENLGKSDKELFDAFDAFCLTHDPNGTSEPRQPPGVLRSEWSSQ